MEFFGAGALAGVAAAGGGARRAGARLLLEPYRNDLADAESLAATFTALHALLGRRRTLVLETHLDRRSGGAPLLWFALQCPAGLERQIQAALRASYPNLRLRALRSMPALPAVAIELRRAAPPHGDDEPLEPLPRIERVLAAMAAAGPPASLRLILRPAPRLLEQVCSSPEHRIGPLVWALPVVHARDLAGARAIASALCAGEPRLLARRGQRLARAGVRRTPRGLYRPAELAALWCLPPPQFGALPWLRRAVPIAPAPPGIRRPRDGSGLLRDEHGPVTIDAASRRQHTAVVGAVDQGKTSYLVASVRADLRREECALIVLDPKGDAADAVLSVVPRERVCTLLDMAAPRAGFNPLAVAAAPDAIADQVVAALRGLFGDGEVRGSSDRYLRNAVIAVLACEPAATLWDVARLLEVGEAGAAFRASVADRLIEQPSYGELATFLANELPAQLADARASTTAKLDAPANKLARVLNSPAVKRVLLNDSLVIDLDRVIERREVLVVRGALGEIGAGNVAVLMQLLLGMLDAALSRIQDRRDASERPAVALKVDEAPLVINAAFAQTLALKRSAGLETVACWQTDAQWEPELREQLDALFAHRVLFATASAADARSASALLMAEYSDQIRAGDEQLARLFSPDVRLHLPRHTALASWTTPRGRERPFIGVTLPLAVDREPIAWHARAQTERGGRELLEPSAPLGFAAAPAKSPAATVRLPSDTADGVAPESGPAALRSPPAAADDVPSEPASAAPQSPLSVGDGGSLAAPPTSPAHSSESDGARSACGPPAPSYGELLALDGAARMRTLVVVRATRHAPLAPRDRELLAWLAGARSALSSQIHRRFNPLRSLSATQRQLKRLADAGLLARVQLHRDDGGGTPLCCAATAAAIELLGITARRAPELGEQSLDQLRAAIHLTGWLLALEARAGAELVEVLGPGRPVVAPALAGPGELALDQGVRARDFLGPADAAGSRMPVERFAALRPSAIASLRSTPAGQRDLLVVLEPTSRAMALEPYDHLLAGWWRSVGRYRRAGAPPAVVIVCADRGAALERARAADEILSATLARIGVPAARWERGGRTGIHFAAEEDLHRGLTTAWRVPELPPALRAGRPFEPLPSEFVQLPPQPRPPSAPPPWH